MSTVGAELTRTGDYAQRVFRLRYFWGSLVRNDLRTRYRHSFLGIAWSLARPIGMTAVLAVVFTNAFKVDSRIFVPYLAIGITLWQFLYESMVVGCSTFKAGAAYIRQQPVPLAIFPLRTVLGSAIHATIAFAVGLALTIYYVGFPSPFVLASILPGLVILFLLGLSLATLLGILHTHFPDTQHLLEITLQALFYLTPVMYFANIFAGRGRMTLLIDWNPLTSVLGLIRGPLVYGFDRIAEDGTVAFSTNLYLFHLWYASAFLVLVGGVAWYCLRRFERDLVYWI
jgi:lipopolysaccharide transport system permease protein